MNLLKKISKWFSKPQKKSNLDPETKKIRTNHPGSVLITINIQMYFLLKCFLRFLATNPLAPIITT